MSYSSQVKEEISRVWPKKWNLCLAQAYGILLFCSSFTKDELRIVTQSDTFAAKIPRLFKKAFGTEFDRKPEPGHVGRFVFVQNDPAQLAQIMDACGYDPKSSLALHINYGLLEDSESRIAFLRGAFLAGGSVTDPTKSYHLELCTSHYSVTRELYSLMEECGFRGRLATRKGNHIVYFKQSEEIADLLTMLGAPVAGMEIINAKLDKSVVNKANRRSNCDMANVEKVVAAAQGQLTAIRRLEESELFAQLPPKLREAACLRRDNPELSLTQLAEMCDPPVTKSAFNHRLKKLMELSRTGG
jgi:hypothetical protein